MIIEAIIITNLITQLVKAALRIKKSMKHYTFLVIKKCSFSLVKVEILIFLINKNYHCSQLKICYKLNNIKNEKSVHQNPINPKHCFQLNVIESNRNYLKDPFIIINVIMKFFISCYLTYQKVFKLLKKSQI